MTLRHSLVFRLAAAFLGFVVVGSIALVAWLQFEETRESRAAFLATANANAQFVRSQHLPATERTAQALGEVLGMEAYFWRGGDAQCPIPRSESSRRRARRFPRRCSSRRESCGPATARRACGFRLMKR
jgi:hypothetical protein